MRFFYIPDGHRRYADRERRSLVHAYRAGYAVLVEELILPLFEETEVDTLGIFLLSTLNLERRERGELETLLHEGETLLHALVEQCRPHAHVRSHGSYLGENIDLAPPAPTGKRLDLFVGSRCEDPAPCGEVDVFLRSGGEMRLSGAPRALIGPYTQLYAMDALHPDLRFGMVAELLERYRSRYMRERELVR